MKQFISNLWTKESAFRALLVGIGSAIATGQITWVPESVGIIIMALATMISSGDKISGLVDAASMIEKLRKNK